MARRHSLRSTGIMADIMEWSWLRSYPGGPGRAPADVGEQVRGTLAGLRKQLAGVEDVIAALGG